ncbi:MULTISPECIES: phosphatase PAP2 family protein [Paenibacillus]|uniref:Phosphatidic acid phosphatase type 2/haloperoxidase domain-containing protein n=1 Tax=Paenibacillus borealis TaxID=160799 RepID=A0ABX3H1D1_PAEBO|nr:phosphatase PAP2 family protein [Paenibacillus borealis]OMD42329.1 hypothetical protein BSK56_25895 [Paenibacillus borealis]
MELIKFIQSFASPFWDSFFIQVTWLGEGHFFMILFALCLWCVNKEFGYRMGFAFFSNDIWNSVLKNTFQVPRHFGQMGIRTLNEVPIGGFSFPSGHVQNTSSYVTSLMLHFKSRWVYLGGFLLVLVVSISRLYVGAHTPTDVIGAILAGAGWVVLSEWVFGSFAGKWLELRLLSAAAVLFLGMSIAADSWYYSGAGSVICILASYYLDLKVLRFEIPKRLWAKAGLFIVGYILFIQLDRLVQPLYSLSPLGNFIKGFLTVFWITMFVPLLYTGVQCILVKWSGERGRQLQ